MERKFGKRELIILIILFAALLAFWLGFRSMHREEGGRVRVTVSGETVGEYGLDRDAQIPIEVGGRLTNVLVIEDGRADMVSADCPDQICVNTAPISALKETIVCLPNQVVVEVISSDEEPEFDVIAQ